MMMRKKFGALVKNNKAAAAVEFAIVAPIFFAMAFSILEAGWYFFVNSAVQQANTNAARLIRTGQAQTTPLSRDAFFDEICRVVRTFGNCSEKLTIDVSAYDSFGALAADLSNPVCRNRDDPSIEGAQFTTDDFGTPQQIIRVRVCFLYRPISPGIGLNLDRNNNGGREIVSVAIFRNEPFED